MSFLNAALRGLFDAILFPFRGLHPMVGLLIVTVLTSIGMLIVFKATSNQDRLAAVKSRIHAGLFEIRLFNDDLVAIFRAQGEILRHNLTYLGLSLVPMFFMIVPIVLMIAQLQFHYGYRDLVPGQTTIVKMELEDDWREATGSSSGRPPVELLAPEGLRVETAGVWMPSVNQVAWRVAVDEPGDYELQVKLAGAEYSKSLRSTEAITRRSPSRRAPRFLDQVLYPAEASLPKDTGIRAITVAYPDETISIFGVGIHWLILYFVLSIVFAFALRNRFGVTI